MRTNLKPEQRLIVAADFHPWTEDQNGEAIGVTGARYRILELDVELAGLGVTIKLNSALRAFGYDFLKEIKSPILADLKLHDIPNTLEHDSFFILENGIGAVTVMCSAGIDAMRRFVDVFRRHGGINALGVTILTSHDEEECQAIYGCSTKAGVLRFARMAQLAGLPGLVCSPQEAEMLSRHDELTLTLVTPGVRPRWAQVEGDDQKRVATPAEAIKAGADRIVVGRPITQAGNGEGPHESPRAAAIAVISEIRSALESMEVEARQKV